MHLVWMLQYRSFLYMAFTGIVFSAVQTESLYRMRIRLILNILRIVPHQSESESDRVVLNIALFCTDDKYSVIQ